MKQRIRKFFALMLALVVLTPQMVVLGADKSVTDQTTLEDAIRNATSDDTITLNGDITIDSVLTIKQSITINGGNHKITQQGDALHFEITDTGELTLNNITLVASGTGYSGIYNYGTLNLKGVVKLVDCFISNDVDAEFTNDGVLTNEVTFTASPDSMSLHSLGDLVFQSSQYSNLNLFKFVSIQFIRDSDDASSQLFSFDEESGENIITYEKQENTCKITVPREVFDNINSVGGLSLTVDNYKALIVFEDVETRLKYSYLAPFSLTDPPPPNPPGDDDYYDDDDNNNNPPAEEPTPRVEPGEVNLTEADLDKMLAEAEDGVMLLIIEGDIGELNINVPLSWFMENMGATLLIYNEGLGLMAISSENMIELAAQSYNGEEDGITVTINGRQVTFSPSTIMSYHAVKGSITLTVTADGNSMEWYVYDSPLILGIPNTSETELSENLLVAYQQTEEGQKIMPRSLVRDGLVYLLINGEGTFDIRYNMVNFDDITDEDMKNAAEFVSARDIMTGVGHGKFAPFDTLTRAQYVCMLMRMLDYEYEEQGGAKFTDVDPESWYYESVSQAADMGIVFGVGNGMFDPDRPLTRQELYAMTYRALVKLYIIIPELSEEDINNAIMGYSDYNNISDYAVEAMTEMVNNGIIKDSIGTLNPHGAMNRIEGAKLMVNIIDYIVPQYSTVLP